MIIDELGRAHLRARSTSRSNKLARALAEQGIAEGDGVAILARNHRGFVDDGPRRLEARRERAVHEHDVRRSAARRACSSARMPKAVDLRRGVPRGPGGGRRRAQALRRLGRGGRGRRPHHRVADRGDRDDSDLKPPETSSKFIVLTSGTTGTPKGAQRGQPDTLGPIAALLSKIPLQGARDDRDRRAALPLVGLRALLDRALALLDLRPAPQVRPGGRRSRPIEEHEATALIVVPVMLQRILELDDGDDRTSTTSRR